ncbi:hypothetical protein CB0940_01559 [Cercospora beticola]|uniref:Apple domain-containing protein n=1 Tax=Cercospora beticola TaxID=122368 RepID=A0A2G5I8S7_CERBT|nr:hypothetical protein CB0940_01559 [Cercospora beticola]PIB00904.1 hypothetical protein CB0940_01559 [Cercospora beticola]
MGFELIAAADRLAADSACYQCSDSVTSNNTQFPTGAAIIKRQATASQPACLKATNSVQITSACNCMIPSSTITIRQTISSVITSVRSITNTQNIVATTTTTPTKVITTTRLTVLSRTRWNTVLTTQTTTETKVSVTSWQLQATPSAFYIVDQDMQVTDADLQPGPADADEIHYHVQYDWDQSDDEYAPTIFSLDGTQLQVADLSNVEGAAEGYPVVGQSYDGPGMQMMALSNANGYAVPRCRIEATQDGRCPLRCSVDGNEVNSRNEDGLWSLLPAGSVAEFTNYVLAADVAVDEDGDDETPVDPPTPVDPGTPSTETNCASPTENGSPSLNCPRWIYTDAYLVNGSQPLWQGTAANFTDCRNKCDRNGYCRIGDYECARGICRLFDMMTDHGVINVEGGHKLMRASGCSAVALPI